MPASVRITSGRVGNDRRIPPALRAGALRVWSLLPIIFIVSPEQQLMTHDPTKLSHDAAPAVLVPERFRMNHALPLRWMRALAHLSSVGKTVLQYMDLSDHGSLRLRWVLQPFGGGSSLSCKTSFVSVMPGRPSRWKRPFLRSTNHARDVAIRSRCIVAPSIANIFPINQ
jgi:hypothetical protein